MNLTQKKEVAPGVFGGAGINLTVGDEGSKIEFDCAEAEITEKLFVDEHGKFSADGTYMRKAPGALRPGFQPKSQPAIFQGKISGTSMTLEITLCEGEQKVGSYTLERDQPGRIRRCL